jgi:hypothetical protein
MNRNDLGEKRRLKRGGILVIKKPNETSEVEFELEYLASLPLKDRFLMMTAKSRELQVNLIRNGYREAFSIIKRK